MPDLFHFWFTGVKVNEFTDASTSQMYDPTRRSWDYDLVKAFSLPPRLLGTIVAPGVVLGPLRYFEGDGGNNPAGLRLEPG